MKGRKLSGHLNDSKLLQKDSALWNSLGEEFELGRLRSLMSG